MELFKNSNKHLVSFLFLFLVYIYLKQFKYKLRDFSWLIVRMCSNIQNLASKALVALPPPPERFTYDEWYRQIGHKFRVADDQTLLSDRILEESTRVIENIKEKLDSNKELTELKMREKVLDIEFVKGEIERSRTVIQVEMEALGAFKERIQDALNSIRMTGKARTQKCCILRYTSAYNHFTSPTLKP